MMNTTASLPDVAFYQDWQMNRKYDPSIYGVNMTKDEFIDTVVEDFGMIFHGMWTLDELLLHPREAIKFCDDVRFRHKFFDVPDDFILRGIMRRRKNPE